MRLLHVLLGLFAHGLRDFHWVLGHHFLPGPTALRPRCVTVVPPPFCIKPKHWLRYSRYLTCRGLFRSGLWKGRRHGLGRKGESLPPAGAAHESTVTLRSMV